jgi:DNA-binding IclR family transcriptional regulator
MARETSGSSDDAYRVPAVERAFAILRALAARGALTLADIVDEVPLNKSTAFYILRTLTGLGMVDYDERTRTYGLGAGLMELGRAAGAEFSDVAVAKRELAGLVDELGVTLVLYRRIGRDAIVLVDKLERDHQVRITLQAGVPVPIQGGSFGRAFLAYDPPGRLREVLKGGLRQFTAESVTDIRVFRRDLVTVRDQGWAVDHDGYALGVSTVAAPIFGGDGQICLVVAAVGFSPLVNDEVAARWGRQLRAAADRVGEVLIAAGVPGAQHSGLGA